MRLEKDVIKLLRAFVADPKDNRKYLTGVHFNADVGALEAGNGHKLVRIPMPAEGRSSKSRLFAFPKDMPDADTVIDFDRREAVQILKSGGEARYALEEHSVAMFPSFGRLIDNKVEDKEFSLSPELMTSVFKAMPKNIAVTFEGVDATMAVHLTVVQQRVITRSDNPAPVTEGGPLDGAKILIAGMRV